MFDKEQFIADCRTALQQDRGNRYVRDVVARAVSDPGAVLRELGEPTQAGLHVIHRADDLTTLNVAWPANFVWTCGACADRALEVRFSPQTSRRRPNRGRRRRRPAQDWKRPAPSAD